PPSSSSSSAATCTASRRRGSGWPVPAGAAWTCTRSKAPCRCWWPRQPDRIGPGGTAWRRCRLAAVHDVLCPELIGRGPERETLVAALDAARAGRGGTTVLLGEAGIGKSRLEREAAGTARGYGMAVFTGRAVDGAMTAFRPFAEALQSALRSRELPDLPD